PVARRRRSRGGHLHQRGPFAHARQEHRPRLSSPRPDRDRHAFSGRLPRKIRGRDRRQDALLQAQPRNSMSDKFDVRDNLLYTKAPEWAEDKPAGMVVGITAYAVDQLAAITLVNLEVKVGDSVTAGKAFGTIESVKTLSDLFSPVNGKVTAVNASLENQP